MVTLECRQTPPAVVEIVQCAEALRDFLGVTKRQMAPTYRGLAGQAKCDLLKRISQE